MVHGRIRVPQKLLWLRVAAGSHCHSDRRGDEDLGPVEIVRGSERLLRAAGGVDRLLRIHEVAEEKGELVASEASHGVARPRDRAQSPGDLHQQHVTRGVAQALVHGLETVEVEEEHREAVVEAALLERERLSEPVHEQRAVRQAGEPVVERVVEQFLLGELARGDVGLRSRQPVRSPVRVPHRRAPHQHPAPVSIQMAHAVLDLQVRSAPLQVQGEVPEQALAVVGMDAVEPLVRVVGELAVFRPELLLPAGRKEDPVGAQVPVPEPVVAAQRGERVAFLALPHGFGGALPLADVARDPLDADRHVAPIDQPALQLQRDAPAVLRHHFHFEGLHLAGEVLLHRGAVFGRDQIPDPQPQGLVPRVAGDTLASPVDPGEPALEIVGIDDVAGVLHQLSVGRFLHLQNGMCGAARWKANDGTQR